MFKKGRKTSSLYALSNWTETIVGIGPSPLERLLDKISIASDYVKGKTFSQRIFIRITPMSPSKGVLNRDIDLILSRRDELSKLGFSHAFTDKRFECAGVCFSYNRRNKLTGVTSALRMLVKICEVLKVRVPKDFTATHTFDIENSQAGRL